jgi:hypothetical protein
MGTNLHYSENINFSHSLKEKDRESGFTITQTTNHFLKKKNIHCLTTCRPADKPIWQPNTEHVNVVTPRAAMQNQLCPLLMGQMFLKQHQPLLLWSEIENSLPQERHFFQLMFRYYTVIFVQKLSFLRIYHSVESDIHLFSSCIHTNGCTDL